MRELAAFVGVSALVIVTPGQNVLALGLLFCSLTLVWLTAYAFAVARTHTILRRPAVRRLIEAVTGIVLIALGLRLATERR
jgi:threonine/homoserine/homoserine lactone efflux protein